MNRNMKARRAKDRAHNLFVGAGAALLIAGLIGYGLWTRPAESAGTSGKATEQEETMEITITEANFVAEVLKSDRPVLVDFWATWCGPCRMLAPVLAGVAAEKGDAIKVGKVNVDDEPELAAKFGITGIPALLLFVDGKAVATSVGYKDKERLEAFLAANLP